MNKSMININEQYINFQGANINVILDKDNIIWFNARDIIIYLGYKSVKETIRKHIDKEDKIKLRNIKAENKIKKHHHSVYINESGLYSLLISSRLKKAKEFKKWITGDVIPSIRKHGYYKLKNKYKSEIKEINRQIKQLEKQNERLKRNLKKEKYPKGGLVYVMELENEMYKIGITKNLKKRKSTYNTMSPDDNKIVLTKKSKCPIKIELCLKSMLYKYRYRNKREIYDCSLSVIKKAMKVCTQNEKCTLEGGNEDNVITKYIKDLNLLKDIKQIELRRINKK